VNDLAVCGARPLYISLGLIIEEGLDRGALKNITLSIKRAAGRAGVRVVTGDTKVVGKGSCDRIYINTSGIGRVYYYGLSLKNISPGDAVIVSGGIGEHAIGVISKREGMDFKTKVKSDSAPLNGLITGVLRASRKVRFMRDPTRGGLATTLNELVSGGKFGIAVNEKDVPVAAGVAAACELMGFDPLYLACEGRVVVIAAEEDAARIAKTMRAGKYGASARVIGSVTDEHKGRVYLNTRSGGRRILDMLSGEQLPRIC
jgi:hydrogenase expression/formation protein HypE